MLRRRVDLPSGGYLMIDYAEAMTVIDVNSGSFTGRGKGAKLEDTITQTNLEAAEEVVRQLRLRDIGGIIVIDFIDMARARNRDAVLKTLRKSLDEDRTKTYVVEISPLGLVEMTRQNVTDGVREIMTKRCPTCDGEGVVLSEDTVAIEVDRKLRDLAAENRLAGVPDPRAPARWLESWSAARACRADLELEDETGRHFHFEGTEALPIDYFEVVLEGTPRGRRGARAAVPRGRGGARQDRGAAHVQRGRRRGQARRLLVSVSGAARWSGSSTLVRIEQGGPLGGRRRRWSNPPEGASNGSADGDGEGESAPPQAPRRRGGRNQAQKPAESSS